MKDTIKGYHTCFFCNYEFEWAKELVTIPYQAQRVPEVIADVYAIGKNEGETTFEVICICPKCRIKNKFIHE